MTFDANGGTCAISSVIVPKGDAVGTLPTPTRENYTFAGWYIDSADGTAFTESSIPTSDLSVCAKWIESYSQAYSYTGGVQTFTAPYTGIYQIEIYGAAGGNAGSYSGGKGGYSTGQVSLNKGDVLYVVVGGAGSTSTGKIAGGYNGGGAAVGNPYNSSPGGSGGGATHIASMTGTLSSIGETNLDKIYIVAGGGGGAFKCNNGSAWGGNGGAGGGETGGSSSYGWASGTDFEYNVTAGPYAGGTQTSGYAFGSGGGGAGYRAGGGGGLYGGTASNRSSGSGGSGYIGGVTNGSMTSGANSGNGSATITYISYQ